MTDKIIERVAKALYDATPYAENDGGYEQQSVIYRHFCRTLARAAVEAMREPNQLMLDASDAADNAAESWKYMIDAVLSEPVEKN